MAPPDPSDARGDARRLLIYRPIHPQQIAESIRREPDGDMTLTQGYAFNRAEIYFDILMRAKRFW